ncbi:MAG: MarR family winged helix-turn-helix transcriptional regulator [Alphaproteobacteria bacterium]|uniref:MarR family winged helix-turn-helix transcriptional regulator n=1 Tax=Aestuariivirga sp. TaxID=2650926 RepID=UPI0030166DD2|nr:MarR family winged helix-turn-helix transcriptional regulator [Alphaproteobacteria bacterium]
METSRLLRAVVEQRLRPHGMTRAQLATLSRLDRQDGLAQHEVADALEVQPIAMVRLVDRLSAQGLVERRTDAADRRINRLFITEAGRKRIADLEGFKADMGAELFDGIGGEDIAQMLRTLDRLHASLRNIQAADAAAPKLRKSGT